MKRINCFYQNFSDGYKYSRRRSDYPGKNSLGAELGLTAGCAVSNAREGWKFGREKAGIIGGTLSYGVGFLLGGFIGTFAPNEHVTQSNNIVEQLYDDILGD